MPGRPQQSQSQVEAVQDSQENDVIGIVSDGCDRIPYWRTGRLWALADQLPVQQVPIADLLRYLDERPDHWFGPQPTIREIAERARRFLLVDLEYPLIVSAEGWLLDGYHRLARAWMLGIETVAVVRFAENPEPDYWRDRDDTLDTCERSASRSGPAPGDKQP